MPSVSVSIVIPTYNEQHHLAATLASIDVQTYGHIIEIIVADGGSTDQTRAIALEHPMVVLVDNPGRIQSSGLNHALAQAKGDVIVRVDGHCILAGDYVERCVDALVTTGAAMVGGAMSPAPGVHAGPTARAIASAMTSRLGVGPARFHSGGEAGWVDTVYLGAYRRDDVELVGGYAEDVGVNEDAELAIRLQPHGGIWFDPTIRSSYTPRPNLQAVARQFYRYGRSRAITARRHPAQVRARQLAAPALVLGLLSRHRRVVAAAYGSTVVAHACAELLRDPVAAPSFAVVLPVMHLTWGFGFLQGLVSPPHAATARVDREDLRPLERPTCHRERQPFTPSAEPLAKPVFGRGLAQRSERPRGRMDHGHEPRQVPAHEEESIAEPERRDGGTGRTSSGRR